jgi:hypothetical protein
MSKVTRRTLPTAPTEQLALAGGPAGMPAIGGVNRRAFLLSSAGAAAGVAAVAAGPTLATAALGGAAAASSVGVVTKPSGPPPAEPVMAFVRDAARGEITVMSGLRETTYRDPALAKRLLDAAR